MLLTQKELAERLKVSERTIQRMRNSGQIHGEKVGGQWRFNSKDIDNLYFPRDNTTEDAVPLSELTRSLVEVPISRMISEDRIFMDMKATTMEEAIDELVSPRIFTKLVLDINDLRNKCLQREKLLNTGVGNGVAIPHPRDPISTLQTSGCIVIGRSKAGIDYSNKDFDTAAQKCEPLDGKPVHLFFLICVQTIELHLHLMGKIATLVRYEGFCKICNNPKSKASDIIRAIMERERAEFMNEERE
ncbi:MAG: PTS sugar transporter subunit IIA [Victivallales bacterium]|nr:PTS sugar transporter subunit IIA [Victivallales bacterium]